MCTVYIFGKILYTSIYFMFDNSHVLYRSKGMVLVLQSTKPHNPNKKQKQKMILLALLA